MHICTGITGLSGPTISYSVICATISYLYHTATQHYTHFYLQDIYLDRLTRQIASLEEQLSLYDAQYSAQSQETKAVKENLTEADMELEVYTCT